MGGREKFGYPVLDCDGHITEPLAIWTEYLEPKYREAAQEHFAIQNTPDGAMWTVEEFQGPRNPEMAAYTQRLGRRAIGGMVCRGGAYIYGRSVADIAALSTEGEMWGPESGFMNPGGFDPHARIKEMDEMGVDKAIIIPTFFAMAPGVKDPELAVALCRAYNDWVYDYCKPYPDRLDPLAMLPVQDFDAAVAEWERIAKKGFHIICARPNPMAGHPIFDPHWFPLWDRCQEGGVPLVFHPFPTTELEGGTRFCNTMGVPDLGETLSFTFDNIITVSGLIMHGVLDRYPNLKLALLESSCSWMPGILDRLDKRFYLFRKEMREMAGLKSLSTEIFKRQIYISFESAERAAAPLSPMLQDNLIWASDIPHHDADPPEGAVEQMNQLGISKDIQAKVMGQNSARLFGIPLN